MIHFAEENWQLTIQKILPELPQDNLPIVNENAPIEEIIDVTIRRNTRKSIYVLDDQKKFCGTIRVTSLMKHLFYQFQRLRVQTFNLIDHLTTERAIDLVDEAPHVSLQNTLKEALEKMIKADFTYLPIVDQNELLGEISIKDILLVIRRKI